MKITDSLQTAYNLLTTRSEDQSLVINTLVRPQISRFIARVPGKSQSSYSHVSHPQIQGIIQPPFRVQQQYPPFKKVEKHPNGAIPWQDKRLDGALPGQDRHLNGIISGQDKRPNGSAYRPAQAQHSPQQQVWRRRSEA